LPLHVVQIRSIRQHVIDLRAPKYDIGAAQGAEETQKRIDIRERSRECD
jgi:hypothetical protein